MANRALNRSDAEYHRLLLEIMGQGKHRGDRTGTGTLSIFDHKVKFDMSDGFPLITTKKIHTKSIIHELIWFLNGDTNIKYLNDNGVTIWDEWADENGDLGPVYGKQWVDWGKGKSIPRGFEYGAPTNFEHQGLNQIQNAIDTLNTNPESRRIMISAWNPEDIKDMKLPPCHWAFELYTEELTLSEQAKLVGAVRTELHNDEIWEREVTMDSDRLGIPKRRLSLKWHQRSVDVGLGLPFNIASYAMLLHMFAQQTNMVPGTLVGDLTNVHIYDNHLEQIKEQLSRGSKAESPSIKLNKAKDMFSYKYEDFKIIDYEAHANIKMPVSV